MSDHEFEKQVRQKLDDLKIRPSEEAWKNIEQGLLRRPRVRVAWLWLAVLVAGLAAGGYYIFEPHQRVESLTGGKEVTAGTPAPQAGHSSQPGGSPDKSSLQDIPGEASDAAAPNDQTSNDGSTADRLPAAGLKNSPPAPVPENNSSNGSVFSPPRPHTSYPLKTNRPSPAARDATAGTLSGEQNGAQKTAETNQDAEAAEQPVLRVLSKENIARITRQAFLRGEENITGTPPVAAMPPGMVLPEGNTVAHAASSRKRKTSGRWSYGVRLSGGIVAVNDGKFLNFNSPLVEDVSFTPTLGAPLNATVPPYKPSTLSPGRLYAGGVFVERALSARFSVSAGLNYLQLNTRTKVGELRYGSQVVNNGQRGYLSVMNVYTAAPDPQREYRNKYHFIEIPVQLHTRLNMRGKLPVYFDLGAGVSRLLKSTSLLFDGTTGVYYHDDKLLNRTQASVISGFSFSLFNKSATHLRIGPYATYNVSDILQKDVSTNKNFVALGLDLKLFLR